MNNKKRKKIYAIFVRDNDVYYGYQSFDGKLSKTCVRLYTDKWLVTSAFNNTKQYYSKYDVFVTRIHSKNCPVTIKCKRAVNPNCTVVNFHTKSQPI